VKERIQKVLANYGVDSRRNIEEMIRQGRVAVNGRVMTRLPILIDPEEDKVTVDDEPVRLATSRKGRKPVEKMYFLLNKPRGVYSTNVAQGEQKLAKDMLPHDLPGRVYPVGRLDADSKGLLLMTNDGELTNLLTHPRYEVPKTYRAVIDGNVNEETIKKISEGIWLADKDGKGFKTGRSKIKVIFRGNRQTVLEITIKEGRNRQVRRVFAKMGHKVRELMRIKMGPLTLQGVGPGKFRPLTPKEVKQLYSLARAGGARSEARKPAKPKVAEKSPVEKIDPAEMGVQFEADDELLREAAEESGQPVPRPAKAPAGKPSAKAGESVEFVDISAEEAAEFEAEARQFARLSTGDDADDNDATDDDTDFLFDEDEADESGDDDNDADGDDDLPE
jgi:pseudouridine synthase